MPELTWLGVTKYQTIVTAELVPCHGYKHVLVDKVFHCPPHRLAHFGQCSFVASVVVCNC